MIDLVVWQRFPAEGIGRAVGVHAEGFSVEEVGPLEIDSGPDAARAGPRRWRSCSLDRLDPDLLMVVADRFEMLAPANAALAMRIPIVRRGGERQKGRSTTRQNADQDGHLHLVTTVARRRVRRWARSHGGFIGSAPASITSGSARFGSRPARTELDIVPTPLILVGMHPVTLEDDPVADTRAGRSRSTTCRRRTVRLLLPERGRGWSRGPPTRRTLHRDGSPPRGSSPTCAGPGSACSCGRSSSAIRRAW